MRTKTNAATSTYAHRSRGQSPPSPPPKQRRGSATSTHTAEVGVLGRRTRYGACEGRRPCQQPPPPNAPLGNRLQERRQSLAEAPASSSRQSFEGCSTGRRRTSPRQGSGTWQGLPSRRLED